MKTLFSLTAIAAVFACTTMSAFADDSAGQSGVSIRIGGFNPLQDSTRNATGTTWFAAGVDYRLSNATFLKSTPGYLSLSLDYAANGNYRNMPVMLNFVSGKQIYWSVGVGAGFTRFVQDDGGENDRVRLAYGASLGYNFNNSELPLFVELRYLGNDQPRVAGVGLYLGVRF